MQRKLQKLQMLRKKKSYGIIGKTDPCLTHSGSGWDQGRLKIQTMASFNKTPPQDQTPILD